VDNAQVPAGVLSSPVHGSVPPFTNAQAIPEIHGRPKPAVAPAFDVSARRRDTGLTFRSGPYSGLSSDPMTLSSVAAAHSVVSVPLATLKTSSEISLCNAEMLARATSSI